MTLRLTIMTGIYGVLVPTALGGTAMPGASPVPWAVEADTARFVHGSQPLQSSRPSDDKQLIIRRAADGMFYLNASVNGRPVRFLIDTGASHTILTAKDAKLVGAYARSVSGRGVSTVSGRVNTRWTHLDQVEIAGKDLPRLQAAVIDSDLKVSLLGQNALVQLGRMTFDGDELRLN